MRKLTDSELSEPDVILTIPNGLALPKAVWAELDLYIGQETKQGTVYKIPAYLARQLTFIARIEREQLRQKRCK